MRPSWLHLGWLECSAKFSHGAAQWSMTRGLSVSSIFSVLGQDVEKTPWLAVTRTLVPEVQLAQL